MGWKKAKIFILESHIEDMEEMLEGFKKKTWPARFIHWLHKADLNKSTIELSEQLNGAKKELSELKKS